MMYLKVLYKTFQTAPIIIYGRRCGEQYERKLSQI